MKTKLDKRLITSDKSESNLQMSIKDEFSDKKLLNDTLELDDNELKNILEELDKEENYNMYSDVNIENFRIGNNSLNQLKSTNAQKYSGNNQIEMKNESSTIFKNNYQHQKNENSLSRNNKILQNPNDRNSINFLNNKNPLRESDPYAVNELISNNIQQSSSIKQNNYNNKNPNESKTNKFDKANITNNIFDSNNKKINNGYETNLNPIKQAQLNNIHNTISTNINPNYQRKNNEEFNKFNNNNNLPLSYTRDKSYDISMKNKSVINKSINSNFSKNIVVK